MFQIAPFVDTHSLCLIRRSDAGRVICATTLAIAAGASLPRYLRIARRFGVVQ
jgi:hypothetical protein